MIIRNAKPEDAEGIANVLAQSYNIDSIEEGKDVFEKETKILNKSYVIGLYDFDNDHFADQFRMKTPDGRELQHDFGFLYDLNKDAKADYIIYNGGTMIGKAEEFYYFFYHWIDTDYDGIVDAVSNNIMIHENDSRPDPGRILWIMDRDKDGKPDHVDFIDIPSGKNTDLEKKLT